MFSIKPHYNLFFNGCSFTAGGELEGPDNNLEYQRTHRFSHLVAEHFGMTYENLSECGTSNDWIVEKTIEWFEEGNTCDVAIIQLTSIMRTIWYKDKISYHVSPRRRTKNIEFCLAQRAYYKTFYSDTMGIQNYYKNLFFISNYFKNKNIKYIVLSKEPKETVEKVDNYYGWKKYCQNEKIKYILDIIGIEHNCYQLTIRNENYCPDLRQHFKNKSNYVQLSGAHPSEIGHQKIAQYIIDTIGTFQ